MRTVRESVTRLMFSSRAAELREANSIGVALGPGFPIGLVGVGMLIALKELRIRVSMISGTSMGAVLGALYASGVTAEELRRHATEIFADDGVRYLLSRDKAAFGTSSGEWLMENLRRRAGWDPDFYELRIPLFVVAADRVSQKSVILRHGNVFDAVRASIAMPLKIGEKEMGGMKLADGVIFCPLDTEVLYSEGADFVIAMQAKPITSVKRRSLPLRSRLEPRLLRALGWKTSRDIYFAKPGCDVLLRPRVGMELARDTSRVNEIIDIGLKITYDAIIEIEKGNFKARVSSEIDGRAAEKRIIEFNAKTESKVREVQSHLEELESQTASMSDAQLMDVFPRFTRVFNDFFSELTMNSPDVTAASTKLRARIKNFVELVDQSPFMSRCLRKPQGYAGDYQMMNYLYDNEVFDSQTNMGRLLNYYLFSNPAANAVRNRAKILQGLVQQRAAGQSELNIASIACGPARELAGAVDLLGDDGTLERLVWTLLDQDEDALSNARKNVPTDKRLIPRFLHGGVRDLLRNSIALGQQDILYSLGLFDYLEDKVAIRLLSRLYTFLKEGGVMLIGNFDKRNPARVMMEGLMEWYLIHRTEGEMLELGKQAAPGGRHFVIAEPEGINLILVTSKPVGVGNTEK